MNGSNFKMIIKEELHKPGSDCYLKYLLLTTYRKLKSQKHSLVQRPIVFCYKLGPVFMKIARLSQVLGLAVVLTLRLLSQLSFVLNLYSQMAT